MAKTKRARPRKAKEAYLDEVIQVTCTQQMKKTVEELADVEDRKVGEMGRVLIREALDARAAVGEVASRSE